jgi:hypothetical protein
MASELTCTAACISVAISPRSFSTSPLEPFAHLLDGQAGVVALRKLAASISCGCV